MKKFILFITLTLITFAGFSQTKGISYQAVIIDPNPIELPGQDIVSQPYVSKDVWIKFGIYSGSTLQYEELQKTKTDEYGLVNLIIGSGINTGQAGTFTSLSWDGPTKNIVTSVSFDQGARFTQVSNQRLNYVPYSFFAESAAKLSGVLPLNQGGTGATNAVAARANLGLGNVDNTADADKPVSLAMLSVLDTKESLANKSQNIIADSASVLKYPSVKAIKDYVDSRTVNSNLANQANNANLAAKATALATPRTINGVAFDGTANISIPVGVTPPDADATTKGLVQLAGDLSGTAAAPTIATGAVTTAKIVDGSVTSGKLATSSVTTAKIADASVTDAKIVSVAGSKVAGNIAGNAATATLATTAFQANNATLAASATKLATPRNINGVPFDGTSDIMITTSSSTLSGTIAIANGGTGATTAAGARTNLGLVIGTDVLAQRTFGSAANNNTADFVATTEKGANNGVATLGNNGKIPSAQIPAISFQNVNVVNSDATMTAISGAQVGSIAIRTDNNQNYVLSALPASTLSNWIALATPLYVSTVNGYAGPNVSLTTNDVAEGSTNKYFTDARARNSISAVAPLNYNATTGVVSMTAASTNTSGYLSASDFTTFNNKQTALTAGVDYATPGGNITGNAANVTGIVSIANGGTGTSTATGALANLGAEPTANKSNDIAADAASTTKFPSVKSIKDYVDQQSANAGVADNSITSAKINGTISIAKGGTGASTAAAARTNLGLAIGTDVLAPNASITAATKTKITYDTKGLVTAGADATTADIAPSTNRNYVTDVQAGVISNTSGVNTGDETATTIKSKLGISTLSGSNTGDQTIALTGDVTGSGTGTFATTINTVGGVSSATISGFDARIANNTSSISTLNTSVAANTASITSNTNSIATLTTNVNANTSSITALNTNVAANTISITALNTSVAANTASITSNINSIATLTTNVNANTSSITTLNTNVAANTASIASNTADIALKAPIASPNLTGTPTAPTASTGTNTTQLATTAFVNTAVSNYTPTTSLGLAGGLAGNIPYQTAPGTTGFIPNGAANQFLTSTGSGTYTWTSAAGVTGNFVPYTGATQAVNLGAYDLTVNGVRVGLGNSAEVTNTAIGSGVLSFNSNASGWGTAQTAIGYNALYSNTTGYSNTAVGYHSLKSNTTGGVNTGLGLRSLEKNTTGSSNLALGGYAAYSNTTGISNTALGSSALYYNTTGANNAGLGANALYNLASGDNNLALGYDAGKLAGSGTGVTLTNSNKGTFIGTGTRAGTNTSTNEVVIGYGAIGNGSNTVTVGNLSNTATYFTGDINLTGKVSGGTWSGTVIGSNYGGAGNVNGLLKANGTGVVSAAISGTDYLVPNAAITAATKTKITYDAKGFVTAGADATTADIAPSTNRNYVTDAQAGILSNTSGTNTGDQTIILTGDVAGSGNGSFATTVNSVGGVSSSTIATLPTSIAANTSSITTLNTNVAANTASITSNTADIALKAPIASPNLTGTPTAPTATAGTNTTQLATTAFVNTAVSNYTPTTSLSLAGGLAGNIPYQTAPGTTGFIPNGAANQFLTSTGSGTYTWTSASGVTGNFVPYTGATQAVNLGAYDLTVNGLTVGKGAGGNSLNTSMGYQVMPSNTTGYGNIAMGYQVLQGNTTGYNNTVMGYQGMQSNTTGYYNTAIGATALTSNITGAYNTALGYMALNANTTSHNTGLGNKTLLNLNSGTDNVAIGSAAGMSYGVNSNLTSSSQSVFIGSGTKAKLNTTTNEIVIGYGATGNGSNTVTVGNLSNTATYFTGDINLTGKVSGGTWSGTVIGSNYGGAGTVNGLLKANGTGVVSAAISGTDYLVPNATITAATKTKITYDAKGLVTAGADATTADIAPSTNRNYVTDAQAGVISNTSGTNTGDQTITLTGDIAGSGTGIFATTINTVGGVSSSTIATLPTSIASNTSSITALNTSVTANTSSITSNTNSIATLTTNVNANTSSITALNTSVAANTSSITSLNTTVIANTASITSNTNNIASLTSSVNTLTGNVTATTNNYLTSIPNLTEVGTIISGVWSGSTIDIAHGGTGATTAAGVRSNLGLVIGTNVLAPNAAITAATKTKITYDVNGLVTAGADATTADIAASTNRNYVTDAQAGVISNTSGINTGDETASTIKTKLGISTLSGSNTGDQTITLTGDVTGTGTGVFAATLTNTTVTAGTYGSATSVPTITVDSKGRLTAVSTSAIASGISSVGAISGTSTPTGATITSGVLNLAPADASYGGIINTVAQTFAGTKTFNSDLKIRSITAGQGNSSLQYNTAFGVLSLATISSGNNNSGYGYYALRSNTQGAGNTAIGSWALNGNTTGSDNIAIGYLALSNKTTYNRNIAIGNSVFTDLTGDDNVAIGNEAGSSLGSSGTVGTALKNIFLGSYAGKIIGSSAANSTSYNINGRNSVLIGYDVRPGADNETNEIVISGYTGTGIGMIGNGSNTTTIGNASTTRSVIFGSTSLSNLPVTASSGNGGDFNLEAQDAYNVSGNGNGGNINLTPGSANGTGMAGIVQVNSQLKIAGGNPGAGKFLTSDANGLASWTSVVTGVSTLTYSALSYANGGTISGTTLTLAAADVSNPGLMSTASQAFTGLKTFNDGAVVSYINTNNANANIAFGYQGASAYQNGTGTKNIAIGSNAMGKWVSGKSGNTNVAIGDQALYGNTTGSGNIALGYQSLYNNTGDANIAIGNVALNANTSGYYNLAVGAGALQQNTTGRWNVALGYGSLENNTADQNTAIGLQSLNKNTTGQNDALGYGSLFNNTTGDRNTAIGNQALGNNTTANGNVAVGNAALNRSTTSPSNVAIGQGAGAQITTDASNLGGSIFIGKNAGTNQSDGTANSTGYNNIFIGREVMPLNNGDNNEIVIGNYINPSGVGNGSIGLGSNSTSIGNANTTKAIIYASSSLSNLAATASSGNGGDFTLKAQDAYATGNNNGGSIVLTPGAGANSGVSGQITANGILTATSIQNTPIGSVTASSGKFTSITGSGVISVLPSVAAASTDGSSSTIAAQDAGSGTQVGGRLNLWAGDGTGGSNGGDVYIQPGSSSTAGNIGSLLVNTTSKSLISTYSPAGVSILVPSGHDGFTMKHLGNGNNFMNLWQTGTSGANMIAFHKGDTPAVVGTISVSSTATAYNTTSDYRLKTDFKDFLGSKLLDSIKVYDYQWKVDGSRSYGVKAHELQSIIPYAVSGDKDAVNADGSINPQTVDYSKIVPVLIKAVQEQEAVIKEAQKENTSLRSELDEQKKRLERLEKLLEKGNP